MPPPYQESPPPYTPPYEFALGRSATPSLSSSFVNMLANRNRCSSQYTFISTCCCGVVCSCLSYVMCHDIIGAISCGLLGSCGGYLVSAPCFVNVMCMMRQDCERYFTRIGQRNHRAEGIEMQMMSGDNRTREGDSDAENSTERDITIVTQPRAIGSRAQAGQGTGIAVLSTGCSEESDEERVEDNDTGHNSSSASVTVQVRRSSSPTYFLERETVLLSSKDNHQEQEEQCYSLANIQSMLLPMSMQVMQSLKTLVLKVSDTSKAQHIYGQHSSILLTNGKRQYPVTAKANILLTDYVDSRIRPFIDEEAQYIENKFRSYRVGMIIEYKKRFLWSTTNNRTIND